MANGMAIHTVTGTGGGGTYPYGGYSNSSNVAQRQGYVRDSNGNWVYDPNKDRDLPDYTGSEYDEGMNRLSNLMPTISSVYEKLRAAGKDTDAWMLRDATKRFANSGKAMGVNAFARAQSLADLQGRLTAARNTTDAQISQQEIAAITDIQREIARLGTEKSQRVFENRMKRAQFREEKQQQDKTNTRQSWLDTQGALAQGFNQEMQLAKFASDEDQRAWENEYRTNQLKAATTPTTPTAFRPGRTAREIIAGKTAWAGTPGTTARTGTSTLFKQPTTAAMPTPGSWEAANAQALKTGGMVSQGPNGWIVLSPGQAMGGVIGSAIAGTKQDLTNKGLLPEKQLLM